MKWSTEVMISTKMDLKYYMEEDRNAYHKPARRTVKEKIVGLVFKDRFYEYMKCLRKLEYYQNSGGVLKYWYAYKLGKLKQVTGIDLDANVAGPGLHLPHGKVVINARAKIGEHCKIMSDVTIGVTGRHDDGMAPRIGNRVFIGTGARIIGDVEIADDVVIGANAVIIKSCLESNVTIAGNPAKIINHRGSEDYVD